MASEDHLPGFQAKPGMAAIVNSRSPQDGAGTLWGDQSGCEYRWEIRREERGGMEASERRTARSPSEALKFKQGGDFGSPSFGSVGHSWSHSLLLQFEVSAGIL